MDRNPIRRQTRQLLVAGATILTVAATLVVVAWAGPGSSPTPMAVTSMSGDAGAALPADALGLPAQTVPAADPAVPETATTATEAAVPVPAPAPRPATKTRRPVPPSPAPRRCPPCAEVCAQPQPDPGPGANAASTAPACPPPCPQSDQGKPACPPPPCAQTHQGYWSCPAPCGQSDQGHGSCPPPCPDQPQSDGSTQPSCPPPCAQTQSYGTDPACPPPCAQAQPAPAATPLHPWSSCPPPCAQPASPSTVVYPTSYSCPPPCAQPAPASPSSAVVNQPGVSCPPPCESTSCCSGTQPCPPPPCESTSCCSGAQSCPPPPCPSATQTDQPCLPPCAQPADNGTAPGSFAPCPPGSGVEGSIHAGPTCPVEREDQPCPDRPVETTLRLVRSDGSVAATGKSNSDGKFRFAAPPGKYQLVADYGSGPGGTGGCPPVDVVIERDHYSYADVSCDTGIR